MYSIHVHIKNDIVSILLDTSGESLNRRGYREKGNRAPLKETLAAALVKLSGWRPNKDILYDPFCGSGTILIEAALIGANVAPGQADRATLRTHATKFVPGQVNRDP